jgi:glycosyltransferase involved in cell wall biosynthesis
MKILFFNRWVGMHVGGTETHIKGLALRLANRGHDIHILTTTGHELDPCRNTVRVWDVPGSKWEKKFSRGLKEDPFLLYFAALFLLGAFVQIVYMRLRGVKFDVVSVHGSLEGFFVLCFRWLLRTPYVFVLEGYTKTEAWLARYADGRTAISESLSERIWNTFGYRPIVIPVGTDTQVFTPLGEKLPKPGRQAIVLTVSRLSTHKRIDILISAAKILTSRDPENSPLVLIVGDGKDRQKLENLTKVNGLDKKVLFVGPVQESELPRYYRSADVFVNCEAAPDDYWITCQEAVSCGAPVIWTSESASINETKIGKWGLMVLPGRPDLLANAIQLVLRDADLRSHLIDRGLQLSQLSDWDRVQLLYEDVYKDAVSL